MKEDIKMLAKKKGFLKALSNNKIFLTEEGRKRLGLKKAN